MARIRGMVQVSGTTYRIETLANQHAVVRIRDHRRIGAFASSPKLMVLESEVAHHELANVATAAALAGLLPWSTERAAPVTAPSRRAAGSGRRTVAGVSRFLLLLWPAL
jgi:hypothetical protein